MSARVSKRIYLSSDANLLQEANLNLRLLTDRLALFAAEDITMDAAFLSAYAADIDAAEETSSDSTVRATVGTLGAAVRAARQAVAKKVRQLRYHVLEAFGDDVAMQQSFGLPQWKKARQGVGNTLQFLKVLHRVALEHADALATTGFDAGRIAEIETLAEALSAANDAQEAYKNSRPKLTADRIAAFNAVYARIARINALAQIVFADDYDVRRQFMFDAKVVRKKPKTKQAAWEGAAA